MASWNRDVLCVVFGLTCLAAVGMSQGWEGGATQAQVNAVCTSGVNLANHPSDCAWFVKCIGQGVGMAIKCPGKALWYDSTIQGCNWRSFVTCANAPNPATYTWPKCWWHTCRFGTCREDNTVARGYACDCWLGYEGENCNYDKNECIGTNPCQNGGTCVNARGWYVCNCPTGFSGRQCQDVGVGK